MAGSELYKGKTSREELRHQSKLIDIFVRGANNNQSAAAADDIRKYLSGEGGIEHVYACMDILKEHSY